MKERLYNKTPCSNCPFRKDTLKSWLGEERVKEIIESDSFVCHKTLDYTFKQCAGHMILNKHNIYHRISKLFNYDLELTGQEKVFSTIEEFINHHKRNNNGK